LSKDDSWHKIVIIISIPWDLQLLLEKRDVWGFHGSD
jgi:hypothetical protein